VDPHNLELELTETVLMRDAQSAVRILHALKAIGVQLAEERFWHRLLELQLFAAVSMGRFED
jgi:predicted signal transduction protein with EAL and GGDEF domain